MDQDGEIDREAFEDIILQVSITDNACDLLLHGVASASVVRYESLSVFHGQKRICLCPIFGRPHICPTYASLFLPAVPRTSLREGFSKQQTSRPNASELSLNESFGSQSHYRLEIFTKCHRLLFFLEEANYSANIIMRENGSCREGPLATIFSVDPH